MSAIDYYFCLNSPWSYMGGARLAKIAEKRGAGVNVRPIKLGAVFDRTGGLPLPKRSPERQAYRLAELRRWSKFLNIPLVREPRHFPFDESEGVRLVLAARETGGGALALATEIGRSLWEMDENPADKAVLDAAAARAGHDAASLRKALGADDAEARWSEETEAAIRTGVFAVPTYVTGGEMFWGQDRLDFVERALE